MLQIIRSETFDCWLLGSVTVRRVRIIKRLQRLGLGNPGDVEPVGSGVSELRIDYGPGYRVYYTQRGQVLVVILCGGDKRTQHKDIKRAIEMAADLE